MKFKVGDRVTQTIPLTYGDRKDVNGLVVELTSAGRPYPYIVKFDGDIGTHYFREEELKPVDLRLVTPTLNVPGLYPQSKTILRHLQAGKGITPLGATFQYHITRLAAVIHDLRSHGYNIRTEMKYDDTGAKYAKYWLN